MFQNYNKESEKTINFKPFFPNQKKLSPTLQPLERRLPASSSASMPTPPHISWKGGFQPPLHVSNANYSEANKYESYSSRQFSSMVRNRAWSPGAPARPSPNHIPTKPMHTHQTVPLSLFPSSILSLSYIAFADSSINPGIGSFISHTTFIGHSP